jgi:hypothetical protein
MIPVEAVTNVGEDGVTTEQGTQKVTGSPPFDTDVVPPATGYQRDVYGSTATHPPGDPTDPGASQSSPKTEPTPGRGSATGLRPSLVPQTRTATRKGCAVVGPGTNA